MLGAVGGYIWIWYFADFGQEGAALTEAGGLVLIGSAIGGLVGLLMTTTGLELVIMHRRRNQTGAGA